MFLCAHLCLSASANDLFMSPALSDNASAVWVNPAGLGTGRSPNLMLHLSADSSQAKLVSHVSAHLGRMGIAVSGTGKFDRYAAARGWNLGRGLCAGVKVEKDAQAAGLDLGFQYRPVDFVSLGAASSGLLPRDTSLSVLWGGAVRILGFCALGADGCYRNEKLGDYALHTTVKATTNLTLTARYRIDDQQVFIGGGVYAGHLGFGYGRDPSSRSEKGFISLSQGHRPRVRFPGKRIAEIEIQGLIRDRGPEFSLMGPVAVSSSTLIRRIRSAGSDPFIKGIVLKIRSLRAGMATLEELRNAILQVQLAGKRVVAHLEYATMGTYYLATAASEIAITPSGYWFTPGFGYEVMLYRGFFDKIGVEADYVVAGEYKGAVEPYRADSLSPEFRENQMRVLNAWHARMVERIAVSRELAPSEIDSLLHLASFQPGEAKAAGLVDRLCYFRDLYEAVWGKGTQVLREKGKTPYRDQWGRGKRIALLHLSGMIIPGRSFTDFMTGAHFAGASTISDWIRKATEAPSVGAIVVRISSGGGSSLAGDIIWHELMKARKKKPVIISVGNMAASAAYYIACAGGTIMADPGSIVGSIGVYAGKFAFSGLHRKLGLKTEVFKTGDKAGAFSPSRPFSPAEKSMVAKEVHAVYRVFKDRVAEGRGLDAPALDSLCGGRIFTGEQGRKNGLVDVLGDLQDAISLARDKAGIRSKRPPLDIRPRPASLWSSLQPGGLEQARENYHHLLRMLTEDGFWALSPVGAP